MLSELLIGAGLSYPTHNLKQKIVLYSKSWVYKNIWYSKYGSYSKPKDHMCKYGLYGKPTDHMCRKLDITNMAHVQ